MDDRDELIRQVARIELATGIPAGGLQSGLHRSVFRGEGIEFAEIREYVPGDDIRSIDWKVTARYNRPFVKEFAEECDQTFYFLVDVSASGTFGSERTKQRRILELLASLGFAALRNNDRTGLCLFSDRVETFVPARRGRAHLVAILNTVIDHQPASAKTDLETAAAFLSRALPRRSSVIVLSDFVSPPFLRPLAILARRHEVIALRVLDTREREIPDVGLVTLDDPETGEQLLVDTSNAEFRERYRRLARESEEDLHRDLGRLRIRELAVTTGESYDVPLRAFFSRSPERRSDARVP